MTLLVCSIIYFIYYLHVYVQCVREERRTKNAAKEAWDTAVARMATTIEIDGVTGGKWATWINGTYEYVYRYADGGTSVPHGPPLFRKRDSFLRGNKEVWLYFSSRWWIDFGKEAPQRRIGGYACTAAKLAPASRSPGAWTPTPCPRMASTFASL